MTIRFRGPWALASAFQGANTRVTIRRSPALSGSKLDKAGCREIAVEGESLPQPVRAHQRKAGRVHERVFALIVLAQPPQCRPFVTLLNWDDLDPWRALESIEESDRGRMAGSASQIGPGFTAYLI